MKNLMRFLVLTGTLAIPVAPTAQAISFEEVERLDKAEQSELLERARQAARSWDFSAAQRYLGQARNKGYAPKDIKAVETLIAQNQSAKAADDERKRRAEEERRQRELVAQQGSSGGGSGGDLNTVIVKVEGCYFCGTKNLRVSGGPGNFSSHNAISGGIHRGYSGGLAGRYDFQVTYDSGSVCTGSFSVSGTRPFVNIELHRDCSISSISEGG